jgi:hypothetical protein
MSRIFLSHSSKNNAEALALREWLARQGWHDVFLDIDPERGLVAADRWQQALRSAIGRCKAVIYLISDAWLDSDNCKSELDGAGYAGAEPIGVLIEDVDRKRVPSELSGERQMPRLFRGGNPVKILVNPPPSRKSVEVIFSEEELRSLRAGLARLGLVGFETESFQWPPSNEPRRAPFRGLESLDPEDAGVFFGRDTDLVRAREHLIRLRGEGARKLFVIQGASGSGKSSFLRAGLWPRLQREECDFVTLPLIRPSTAALSGKMGLAASLERAFEALQEPRALGEIVAALEQDDEALPSLLNQLQVLAMRRLVSGAKPQVDRSPTLVLPIDQAEELFAVEGGEEAISLRKHLASALTKGPDTIGLLTIRSDRFALLQRDAQFYSLLEPFNLPPMRPFIYRDAILKPAYRANPPIEIEPQLADALIADMATAGADPLPLLAFTMERLYRRYGGVERISEGRKRRYLSLKDYAAIGRLNGSFEAAITEAFVDPQKAPQVPEKPEEQEKLLKWAFVPAMVDINATNGEPLSRAATKREIPEACHNIILRLVDARLVVSDRGQADDNGAQPTTYRVAHEALFREWGRLRDWLEQERKELETLYTIQNDAAVWDRNARDPSNLKHRDESLSKANYILNKKSYSERLTPRDFDYLKACQNAQQLHSLELSVLKDRVDRAERAEYFSRNEGARSLGEAFSDVQGFVNRRLLWPAFLGLLSHADPLSSGAIVCD